MSTLERSNRNGHPITLDSDQMISLQFKIKRQFLDLDSENWENGAPKINGYDKEYIRKLHSPQRTDRLSANSKFLECYARKLLPFFASGSDVVPEAIRPKLERVHPGTWQSKLFRLAALTWSVPVSNGFGRRLRYVIWDAHNDKLIGLIAIGDPVFNLSVRDSLIGWDADGRRDRLVNLMDAYVLGALPPYSNLLGGKMIACLVRSRQIYNDFTRAYGNTSGIISGKKKGARLIAVTTCSSMGRSSVYNRLKLDGMHYFEPIGYTCGWGHFHVSEDLFHELRNFLRSIEHPYADQHRFGQGPNWRLRTTRAAFLALGLGSKLLRHGIRRQVFISRLASNASKILRTGKGRPNLSALLTVSQIANLALERWILPRAKRCPEYRSWDRSDILQKLTHSVSNPQSRVTPKLTNGSRCRHTE